MPPPDLERATAARLRTAQIITAALIAGQVFFLAIVLGLLRSRDRLAPAGDPVVSLVLLAFAGVIVVAFFAVPRLMLTSWRRQIARGAWPFPQVFDAFTGAPGGAALEDPTLRWWNLFQTHHLIRCALLEGGAFMELIAYLLQGQVYSLAAALGFLAGILVLFPTRVKVESWIRTQQDAVEALKGGIMP
jgi:hypothetical protein